MQRLIKQLEISYLKKLEKTIDFTQQKEQNRLEVYKDLGQKTLSEYNESFLNFKMNLK